LSSFDTDDSVKETIIDVHKIAAIAHLEDHIVNEFVSVVDDKVTGTVHLPAELNDIPIYVYTVDLTNKPTQQVRPPPSHKLYQPQHPFW
jgi:hypothetical protein